MQVVLRIVNSKSNVRQLRLTSPTTVIGRGAECQLKVASDSISRRHCEISIKDHWVTIRDLKSSNGTHVNGREIPPDIEIPLTPGTKVNIGSLYFSIEYELPPAPKAGAPIQAPGGNSLKPDPVAADCAEVFDPDQTRPMKTVKSHESAINPVSHSQSASSKSKKGADRVRHESNPVPAEITRHDIPVNSELKSCEDAPLVQPQQSDPNPSEVPCANSMPIDGASSVNLRNEKSQGEDDLQFQPSELATSESDPFATVMAVTDVRSSMCDIPNPSTTIDAVGRSAKLANSQFSETTQVDPHRSPSDLPTAELPISPETVITEPVHRACSEAPLTTPGSDTQESSEASDELNSVLPQTDENVEDPSCSEAVSKKGQLAGGAKSGSYYCLNDSQFSEMIAQLESVPASFQSDFQTEGRKAGTEADVDQIVEQLAVEASDARSTTALAAVVQLSATAAEFSPDAVAESVNDGRVAEAASHTETPVPVAVHLGSHCASKPTISVPEDPRGSGVNTTLSLDAPAAPGSKPVSFDMKAVRPRLVQILDSSKSISPPPVQSLPTPTATGAAPRPVTPIPLERRGSFPRQGHLLGIDHSATRTGFAICNSDQTIASLIESDKQQEVVDAKRVTRLIADHNIVGLVVSLPVTRAGEINPKTAEIQKFAEWLTQVTSLPVMFADERSSSRFAAQVMLQGYLENRRSEKAKSPTGRVLNEC